MISHPKGSLSGPSPLFLRYRDPPTAKGRALRPALVETECLLEQELDRGSFRWPADPNNTARRPGRSSATLPHSPRPSTSSEDSPAGERRADAVCYSASMRPGRTKTTSFSLDQTTLQNLKALAARRHNGNVSALLAEFATREAKFAAAEAYFEKYGIPPLTPDAIERIEAEWQGVTSPKKKRRRAA